MPRPRPPRFLSRWVDELATSIMVVMASGRAFARTRPGPPLPFDEVVRELGRLPPRFVWPLDVRRRGALPNRVRVRAQVPSVGKETYFDLFPARPEFEDPAPDTLIVYHHGLGEIPHDALPWALRRSARIRTRCDLVAIKGVHHEHPRAVSDLLNCRDYFTRCLGASAALARAIAKDRREQYRHLVLCGASMGGVITLFEACREPRFDLYVPLIAGPDLADVILRSSFSRLVQGEWLRRARREPWGNELELTERLAAEPGPPIRALLGRDDRLFRLERQLASYARIPRALVNVVDGGHITAVAQVKQVTRHLLRALREERWAPAERQAQADWRGPRRSA